MRSAWWRFLVCALALGFAAGCGGRSGGGGTGGGGDNPPTAVTFTFDGTAPTAVAAKIGLGAFTVQTLSSSQLTLSIPSGTTTFAVAYVCQTATGAPFPFQITSQTVAELSTADGSAFTEGCAVTAGASPDGSTGQTGILTGSVDASAISGATAVNIYAENGSSAIQYGSLNSPSSFSFSAPVGNDRVEVLAFDFLNFQGLLLNPTLLAAKNFPSQTVPGALNGGNPVVLGPADQVSTQPITYSNVPSGYAAPSAMVLLGTGAGGFVIANQATSQYPALPAGATQTGDRYYFFASAYRNSTQTEGVSVELGGPGGGPVVVSFPPPWSYPGPAPAALPAFDFAYSGFSSKTGVFHIASTSWSTGDPTQSNSTQNSSLVTASANSLSGSSTVTFPDLSGVAGFPPPPPSGTEVAWTALIAQVSGTHTSSPLEVIATQVTDRGLYNVP
jgi:hypothetical protein